MPENLLEGIKMCLLRLVKCNGGKVEANGQSLFLFVPPSLTKSR